MEIQKTQRNTFYQISKELVELALTPTQYDSLRIILCNVLWYILETHMNYSQRNQLFGKFGIIIDSHGKTFLNNTKIGFAKLMHFDITGVTEMPENDELAIGYVSVNGKSILSLVRHKFDDPVSHADLINLYKRLIINA